MHLHELKDLISDGEAERIEFKRSTGQRTEGARTVCAMLNGLGGFVLFRTLFARIKSDAPGGERKTEDQTQKENSCRHTAGRNSFSD